MPTKLFISYSREDKAIAHKVAEALALHDYDVFWDVKIPAGERFDTYLFGKLNESDVIVVLWSTTSVMSDYVKEEAEFGKNKNALVPLRIDDTDLPFGFTRIQTTDIRDWCRSVRAPEWQLVVESIEAAVDPSSSDRRSAPELVVSTPAGSQRGLRRRLSSILALGVVAAMLAGFFVLGRYFRTEDAASVAGGQMDEPALRNPVPPKAEAAPSADPETPVAPTARSEATDDRAEGASKAPEPWRVTNVAHRPADLTVVVYPWGEVWINGKSKGRAPLRNLSLKPGRYRISAGRGEATATRTVRLAPGEEKKVLFDLTK